MVQTKRFKQFLPKTAAIPHSTLRIPRFLIGSFIFPQYLTYVGNFAVFS
jgi:hypothetical protein